MLRRKLMLDTKPSDTIDGITALCSEIFTVPVVFVSLAGGETECSSRLCSSGGGPLKPVVTV